MEQLGAWSGTQGVHAITEAAFELMGNGREGFGCDLEVEAPTHFVWMLVGWEAIRQRESPREEKRMCMSCGCGEPHETHGDKRNIVYADLKKAADASKIPVKEAVRNIEKTLRTEKPRSLVTDDR